MFVFVVTESKTEKSGTVVFNILEMVLKSLVFVFTFHVDNPEIQSLILILKSTLSLTLLAALFNPSDYPLGTKLYRK
jgi:hypothetical protein